MSKILDIKTVPSWYHLHFKLTDHILVLTPQKPDSNKK